MVRSGKNNKNTVRNVRYGHDTEPYIHAIRFTPLPLSQETNKRVLNKCLLFKKLSLFQNIDPVLDHLKIHGKVEKFEFIARDDGFFSGGLIILMSSIEEVDKILELHNSGVLQAQATLFKTSIVEKYIGMEFHSDLKVAGKFMLKVDLGLTEVTPHDFVLFVEGCFIDYNFTRIVPYYKAKGKVSGHALVAFASEDAHKAAWEMAVNKFGYNVVDVTGCVVRNEQQFE